MRLQFGLRTMLVVFAGVACCVYFFRNGCETWEINRVRREMPEHGFSLKYHKQDEGLLFTMVTSREPIRSIKIYLQDDQQEVIYDSGRIEIPEKYFLKFFLHKQQSEETPNTAEFLHVELPATLQGANYELTDLPGSVLGYMFAAEGCTVKDILDDQRRHYRLWVELNP